MKLFYIGLLPLLFLPLNTLADNLDYYITKNKFYTSEGKIPNGCFGSLMTNLNGDNVIASIYINRASLRGCVAANSPYPGGYDKEITYKIISPLGNNSYKLTVCEEVDGSMGATCSKILVEFKNRSYKMPLNTIKVLVLEKTGEW